MSICVSIRIIMSRVKAILPTRRSISIIIFNKLQCIHEGKYYFTRHIIHTLKTPNIFQSQFSACYVRGLL